MNAKPCDKNWPIKLNLKCDTLFQRPKTKIKQDDENTWFDTKCPGIHSIENISKVTYYINNDH